MDKDVSVLERCALQFFLIRLRMYSLSALPFRMWVAHHNFQNCRGKCFFVCVCVFYGVCVSFDPLVGGKDCAHSFLVKVSDSEPAFKNPSPRSGQELA